MSLVLAFAAAAFSPAFADLDAVDRAVAGFTGASPGMPGGAAGPVDRRLRLQPCAAPLALAWRTPGRATVVVQCPDAGGWRLYVPVAGGAGPGAVDEPPAIVRGDAVAIAVTGDGFAVSQPGEALESGAPGTWIKVRPAGVPRTAIADTLRAQVVRPGLVELPLP